MFVLALADFWNELYAAGGFWIGAVSLVVGVLGFWYAIVQVWKTQAAAEAAKRAADETRAESRETFRRYLVMDANRTVSELRILVVSERWETAGYRADDLAEALAQIAQLQDDPTPLAEQIGLFRRTAETFRRRAKGESAAFHRNQWADRLIALHAFLDEAKAPFMLPRSSL